MDVRWSALDPSDQDSLTDWAALTNLLAKVDQTDEYYEAEDLHEELHEPGVDPALDTFAVRVDGTFAGFGQLRVSQGLFEGRVRAGCGGGVHPDFRGLGLGRQLMDRLEARARQLSAERHPGVEVLLRAGGGIEGASVRPMLEHRGYRISRYYHEMERRLTGELPLGPNLPVRQYTPELSESAMLAHNEAFSTHWGSTPWSEAEWQDFVGSRTFRPSLCFLSLGPDGEVDAFAMGRQWVDGEIWVDLVGTRKHARGRGLARACLSALLRAAAEQGYRVAGLGVDTQNGQNAGALYSSLGFEVVRVLASYSKAVPPL
jgi:mycothiol synthase